MLVAFEGGGLLRALVLFLLYPLIWLVGREQVVKIMVFVRFVGLRKDKCRIGRSVMPKLFLEVVRNEGFTLVTSGKRKVAVSNMPRIMVECFLKDYLGVDDVHARELKGAPAGRPSVYDQLPSGCKEIYQVKEADIRNWKLKSSKGEIPTEVDLIIHDARLALRPTPLASLIMFMWLPIGILIFVIKFTCTTILPSHISHVVNSSTGVKITVSKPKASLLASTKNVQKPGGVLYVCNHRTLLDPIIVAYTIMKPIIAVTYSMSRFSEAINLIRLKRDRKKDRKLREQHLTQGDLMVCPEQTTCREPYLLRFSPLFAEITDEIVPAAIDLQVNMFYRSTASGIKRLDLFNLLNPFLLVSLKILQKIRSTQACKANGKSRIEVANHVQEEIAKALRFQSTILTRKDKYMILAGNEGIVQTATHHKQKNYAHLMELFYYKKMSALLIC